MYLRGIKGLGDDGDFVIPDYVNASLLSEDTALGVPGATAGNGASFWYTPTYYDASNAPVATAPSAPSTSGVPVNWGDALTTAIKTFGTTAQTYLTSQSATDIAKARANPYGLPINPATGLPYTTLINPATGLPYTAGAAGTLLGLPLSWWLIGGALVGVAIIMSGNK